jgi:hypothetical protein
VIKGIVKLSPVYATKTYRRSRSTAPLNLNLSTRWRWLVNLITLPLYLRQQKPPNRQQGEPQLVWTFWRTGTFLVLIWNRTPDRSDRRPHITPGSCQLYWKDKRSSHSEDRKCELDIIGFGSCQMVDFGIRFMWLRGARTHKYIIITAFPQQQ